MVRILTGCRVTLTVFRYLLGNGTCSTDTVVFKYLRESGAKGIQTTKVSSYHYFIASLSSMITVLLQ